MNLTGIQFRLLLLGILPTIFLAVSLAYYFIQYHYIDLENALKEKGQITVNQLAISSIYGVYSGNTELLTDISNALLNQPDIASVHIIDYLGATLAQSKRTQLPTKDNLIYFQHPVTIQTIKQNISSIDSKIEQPRKLPEKTIGLVTIALSLENTHKRQQTYLLNSLLIISLGIVFTILIAIHLSRAISSPIIKLTKTANKIADGAMDTQATGSNIAEIDDLCQSFNAMALGLQKTQVYLLHQVDSAVNKLTSALTSLEDKNKSLEKSTQLAISQNKTKSQFIAHISHEIRTPMNGVLGFVDLLTKSQLSIQQLEQTQLIKRSATSLLTIVNEILDYSSLETGNFKINTSTFNLRENIENCSTTIFPLSNDVQIIIDIDTDIPSFVSTDPIRLQQIITNLLGNACKFTHQGHIIIRCRLLNSNSLFISISDTGVGIHKDKMKDLFQPFLYSSEYAINNELGTGLGLAICENIIKRLGGTMGLCTQYNTGSTFWLNIPVVTSESEKLDIQEQSILIVDPFKLRRKALVKQFTYLGYITHDYSSMTELTSQTKNAYDLIFYADKNETQKQKRKLNELRSVTNHAPVVFLNSHKKYFPASNFLSLPCRSSYLKNLILTITETNQSSPAQINRATAQRPHSFSIFIADDNEINRLLLKSQLETYCKNITLAEDGKSALSYLQQNKYDLILLDLQMPYYSGMEIIKLIKKTDSINKDSPTVAITAHAKSEQRKSLIEAGFDECLIKPILLDQIFEILDLWIPEDKFNFIHSSEQKDYAMIMLDKTSGNKELAIELFKKLFSELKEQSNEIEQALDNGNLELAKNIIHKLHGSVSFCGFTDIQEIARNLEINLINKNIEVINSNFLKLKNKVIEFCNLKEEILTFLEREI